MENNNISISFFIGNEDLSLLKMAITIRNTVFVKEQHVPIELEQDEYDDSSTHALLFLNNEAVATTRFRKSNKSYKIERFAVLKTARKQHIGSQLLKAVTAHLEPFNATIYCHAQVHALSFWKENDFAPFGNYFQDAGIEHIGMKYKAASALPKRLKVLLLSSWYPCKNKPTNGNFVQRHAEAIAKYADVTVLFVAFIYKKEKEREIVRYKKDGVDTIISYEKRKSVFNVTSTYKKRYLSLTDSLFPTFDFDIIHANVIFPIAMVAQALSKKHNTPFIVTEHLTLYLNKRIPLLRSMFATFYTKQASLITPVTNNLAEGLKRHGVKTPMQRVNNVVDCSLFIATEKPPIPPYKFIHISHLVEEHKNGSGIIRVCAQLSREALPYELHIISDGDEKPYIEQAKQAGILNKQLFFHGKKSIEEIATILPKCHTLLLFSNYENLPCVIVEALASGTSVLSTNVGGIKEHLTPKLGVLIEKGDEKALYHEMKKFIQQQATFDKDKLRMYALNNFSYEAVGQSFITIYQSIIN